MKKQNYWIVVLILMLALAGLACNAVLGDDAEPTADTATGVETPGEAEGETGGETPAEETAGGETTGDAAPTLNLNPENNFGIPSDVNSFRLSVDIQFEETLADGTVESGRIVGTGAQVIDPFAMTFDFTFEGTDVDVELGGGSFSMTQIGDVTYVDLGGTCVSTSGNEAANFPLTEFTSSESLLGSLQGAELVEENVTINGIQTNHYEFDDSALTADQQALGTLENVDGHIYVASDGGHLVRMTMEADGQSLGLGGVPATTTNGHMIYQVDYSDFNAPIEITAPEGCGGAEDSEYPILDDATNVNSFGDVLSYETATAFADVVDFYKTEMAAAGYTLDSEFAADPTASLTFSLDGENVTISVVDSPASENLTVVITKG